MAGTKLHVGVGIICALFLGLIMGALNPAVTWWGMMLWMLGMVLAVTLVWPIGQWWSTTRS